MPILPSLAINPHPPDQDLPASKAPFIQLSRDARHFGQHRRGRHLDDRVSTCKQTGHKDEHSLDEFLDLIGERVRASGTGLDWV
ncbi:hypothetical protein E4U55_002030 [Claviceps digitariae]|nr:hypothetical protein E4U55_002030 [Claviceps digitariae]